MQIVFIRHSMTAGNLERRYIGCRTDEPLCEAGISLAQQKTAEIRQTFPMPEVVLTSPMRRCVQTAEILFPGRAQVQIPEWTEMDFGRFEGKNYRELNGDPDYQAWIDSGGTLPFPGGESREAFIRRTTLGFARVLSYLRAENTMESAMEIRAAAVVHGGTIMALCSSFSEGAYFDFQVKNGEGYVCRFHLPAEQEDDLKFLRKNGMEIRKL